MNLIKYSNFHNDKVNDIESIFDELFINNRSFINTKDDFNPIYDFIEDEKQYVFFSEIPGVDKSDLKVEVFDKTFKVSGVKKEPKEIKNNTLQFNRVNFGDFERTFGYPGKIDKVKVQATFDNGMLKVFLPKEKHNEQKARLVKIK